MQPIRSIILTTCLLVLFNQSGAESCQLVSSLSAYEHLYFDLELFELDLPLQVLSYLDGSGVCKKLLLLGIFLKNHPPSFPLHIPLYWIILAEVIYSFTTRLVITAFTYNNFM